MNLKLMGKNHSDELYTPKEAIDVLIPFLKKDKIIWECAYGTGKLAEHFNNKGFDVLGITGYDFLKEGSETIGRFDYIITNPPFSKKIQFIRRCYQIRRPWALLLPITTFQGKKIREMFRENGIQVLFLPRRIDFNGKGKPWFYCAWFCYGLNLPNQLNFIEEKQDENS